MDEDESLATISIIFLGLIGIIFCLTGWFRMRARRDAENGFVDIDF